MGMIIRAAFNNQNWSGTCVCARDDERLYKCQKGIIDTDYRPNNRGICRPREHGCWESKLCGECGEFRWFTTSSGGKDTFFDESRVEGPVFFISVMPSKKLMLWGRSPNVEVIVDNDGVDTKGNIIHFGKFRPIEHPIVELSYKDIGIGKWGIGTYRYINNKIVGILDDLLIYGKTISEPAELDFDADSEGLIVLRSHLERERSIPLVREFRTLKNYKCSVCGFDFEAKYGRRGQEFIEAHHSRPIASLSGSDLMNIEDLQAVCSNCHRMLHKQPFVSVEELKRTLK